MIIIALPMYNEEKDIGNYLKSVKREMDKEKIKYQVLILDDGSTDNSIPIINQLAKDMPIRVVHHKVNKGLGVTMRDLFVEVAKTTKDNDIVVTMDSDNSHDPMYIRPACDKVQNENYDIVIASRFAPGGREVGLSLFRSILSRGIATIIKILFPIRGVRDYSIGYRAYKATILKAAINKYGDKFIEQTGFPGMTEILIKLRRTKKLKAGEVPLTLRYDRKQGESKLKLGKTIVAYLKLIAKERLNIERKT